mmetsp:Transcript_40840/g.83919  ORF Transcript_40840/g.83919 Transcript_40840/m.83919 type:complete len:789 (+) Transcript_40840:89-2455(+)
MNEGDAAASTGATGALPENPEGPEEDSEPRSPSKGLRGAALAVAVASAAFLVWALASERWHCFHVEVPPAEVYEMFKAMVAILPATGHRTNFSPALQRKLERSTEPHVAFELQAGLWSASANSLCKPHDAIFSVFVDAEMCKAKLLHFCDDILEGSKNDPIALNIYENCRKSVRGGGVSLSFIREPPAKNEFEIVNEYTTMDGLESELGQDEQDHDPDLCDTLANCDTLEAMRPWNLLLIAVMMLTVLEMVTAAVFFAWALFAKAGEDILTKRGCNVMLLAALSLAAVIGLDIYIGEKYPLEDIVRVEDLYYFMLPDGSSPEGYSSLLEQEDWSPARAPEPTLPQLSKRSQKHWGLLELDPGRPSPPSSMMELEDVIGQAYNSSRSTELQMVTMKPLMEIPPTKWKGALAVLGANLMAALATRDMGAFLNPLKEAAKRAWGKSDVIIDSWLQYLQKSVADAPSRGGDDFDVMLGDFKDMKSASDVCDNFGDGACRSLAVLDEVKAEAATLFSSLRSTFQAKMSQAKKLVQSCMKVLNKMKAFWKEIEEPVKRILSLVVQAGKEAGSAGLLNTVVNAMGNPELLEDIQLLFTKLFTNFPHVVKAVRHLADRFVAFVQGLRPLLLQLKDAVFKVKKLLTKGLDKAQVILAEEADSKEAEIKFKISQELQAQADKAGAIWGLVEEIDTHSAQNGVSNASNGTSLLEQSSPFAGNVMGLISNFASAGRLCSPAARVGSIFLSEIQHMHATARGFETTRGGVFQHFGYITFGLMLLFGLVVVSFLLFQLGFLK